MSDKRNFSHDIRVRVPESWKQQLESDAKAENLDMSDIVRRALNRFLKLPRTRKQPIATEDATK